MTVSTEISSNEYTGNGVTTDFDYKFRIFKANQLSVITSDADGDNVVTLRLGTDYTVTGANKSTGGKVILTKPLANGHKISIARDIPIKQETSFRNQSKFFAETHEDAFDYLTMIIQRIWGSLGSLYLKRPNILANWFDAKGYRIANLGKPRRNSDAVDLGTLRDEVEGVNSTILAKEKRTLRVDDMDIAAFPKASDRRNKQVGFDSSGTPILLDPIETGALGYQLVDSFEKGAILTGRFQALFWEEKKEYFRWDGSLPKVVPSNSTPNETGGIKTDGNPNGLWVGIGSSAIISERIFTYRPSGLSLTDIVSVKDYGAIGDGITDDTVAIQRAINNPENAPAYIPAGNYIISDTITIGRGKALIGCVPVLRTDQWSTGAILSWGGAVNPRKTMVLLGQNNVGEEPIKDATAVVLENVYLNGNSSIGFLVYGTYLTNDSWVRGVGGHGSTEYNFYFAKAWYASFCNIVSRQCKNNGIALGMPLYYSEGELVKWTSYAPLEMNQCLTDNIRSHSAGQRYSIEAPKTYDPKKSDAMRFSGYGIGAGVGNAFRLNNFLSEQSGGVNLYYYSEWQPSKHVSNGYLEASCLNSGLDAASTLPNIIIDVSVGTNGGGQVIEDLFMNYSSGGIYTVRRGQVYRPVELKRLYQPRFLKDIDGETDIDKPNHPLNFIKMSSVYYQLSGYNFLGKSIVFQKEDVNIRYGYSFSVPCYDTQDYFRVYFRRTSDNWNPSGSIQFELSNGENVSRVWPSEAPKGQWVSLIILGLFSRIKRGGDSGSVDQPVEFKIVRLPSSQP